MPRRERSIPKETEPKLLTNKDGAREINGDCEQRGASGRVTLGRVAVGLHGIRTHAGWSRAFSEVATIGGWYVRMDRWNFGYFSVIRFLLPWARSAKVRWFRQAYREEVKDRDVPLDKEHPPSIIAHSFGTYILANALLKYDWLRFDKIVLCGSILPVSFPWGKLIDRGQVRAVRNEFGAKDIWSGLVRWFVAGTGPSGRVGFDCEHERFEQERFDFTHSEYFDKGHMEAKWLPFLDRESCPIAVKPTPIERRGSNRPWALYVVYLLFLTSLSFLVWRGVFRNESTDIALAFTDVTNAPRIVRVTQDAEVLTRPKGRITLTGTMPRTFSPGHSVGVGIGGLRFTDVPGTRTFSIEVPKLDNGVYELSVFAEDENGDVVQVVGVFRFTLEVRTTKVPPKDAVRFAEPASGITLSFTDITNAAQSFSVTQDAEVHTRPKGRMMVTGTMPEAFSQDHSVVVSIGGVHFTRAPGTHIFSLEIPKLADGVHKVSLFAEDEDGNAVPDVGVFRFTLKVRTTKVRVLAVDASGITFDSPPYVIKVAFDTPELVPTTVDMFQINRVTDTGTVGAEISLATVVYFADSGTAEIMVHQPLEAGLYRLRVVGGDGGVKDRYGNILQGNDATETNFDESILKPIGAKGPGTGGPTETTEPDTGALANSTDTHDSGTKARPIGPTVGWNRYWTAAALFAAAYGIYIIALWTCLVVRPLSVLWLHKHIPLESLLTPTGIGSRSAAAIRLVLAATGLTFFATRDRTRRAWISEFLEGKSRFAELETSIALHYIEKDDVLDAWVDFWSCKGRDGLCRMKNVLREKQYITLPMRVGAYPNGELISQPGPTHFRALFRQECAILAIIGDGGIGKSALASRLAWWAISDEPDSRLTPHRMFPVFLAEDTDDLVATVTSYLNRLVDPNDALPDLVRNLLARKRLLVIVDSLSERAPKTQQHIEDMYGSHIAVNSLVITSRQVPNIKLTEITEIWPEKVDKETFLRFQTEYLAKNDLEPCFPGSAALELGEHLLSFVERHDRHVSITPLLVKLYIDNAVERKNNEISLDDLPVSMAETFLEYLHRVNPTDGKDSMSGDLVVAAANVLGMRSVERDYVPRDFFRDDALKRMDEAGIKADATVVIDRLVKNGVLEERNAGGGHTILRFQFDSLAEYRAAVYQINRLRDDAEAWTSWLEELTEVPGYPKSMNGFLVALQECVTIYGNDYLIPRDLEFPWS